MNTKKKIWIGLAEIHALNEKGQTRLSGARNGFVNVLAKAVDKRDFIIKIKKELEYLGLRLAKIEDAELLIERERKFVIDETLRKLVYTIEGAVEVQFGPFHVYKD